jgi:hypothetical protein
MTDTLTLDLAQLQDDGDTLEVDQTRALRLRIEVDQDASMNDYDGDGKVEWVRIDQSWSPSRHQRPDSFTGRARVIDHDFPYVLWWEPWKGATDEQIVANTGRIVDLVRFGFKGVILELCDGRDAYGHWIVTKTASLWGIDSLDNGYLAEVVRDLVEELEL